MQRVAEDALERKVSLVREAIEAGIDYIDTVDGHWRPEHPWPDAYELLRAAWLSLPKCAVCGAEEDLHSPLKFWTLKTPLPPCLFWSEPVCLDCRSHPSIQPFEMPAL